MFTKNFLIAPIFMAAIASCNAPLSDSKIPEPATTGDGKDAKGSPPAISYTLVSGEESLSTNEVLPSTNAAVKQLVESLKNMNNSTALSDTDTANNSAAEDIDVAKLRTMGISLAMPDTFDGTCRFARDFEGKPIAEGTFDIAYAASFGSFLIFKDSDSFSRWAQENVDTELTGLGELELSKGAQILRNRWGGEEVSVAHWINAQIMIEATCQTMSEVNKEELSLASGFFQNVRRKLFTGQRPQQFVDNFDKKITKFDAADDRVANGGFWNRQLGYYQTGKSAKSMASDQVYLAVTSKLQQLDPTMPPAKLHATAQAARRDYILRGNRWGFGAQVAAGGIVGGLGIGLGAATLIPAGVLIPAAIVAGTAAREGVAAAQAYAAGRSIIKYVDANPQQAQNVGRAGVAALYMLKRDIGEDGADRYAENYAAAAIGQGNFLRRWNISAHGYYNRFKGFVSGY